MTGLCSSDYFKVVMCIRIKPLRSFIALWLITCLIISSSWHASKKSAVLCCVIFFVPDTKGYDQGGVIWGCDRVYRQGDVEPANPCHACARRGRIACIPIVFYHTGTSQ